MHGRVRLETTRWTSRLAAIGALAFALASLVAAFLAQNVFNKLVLGLGAVFFGSAKETSLSSRSRNLGSNSLTWA